MQTIEHEVQWTTAAPLWKKFNQNAEGMQAPALLCFKTDSFMEELNTVLQSLKTPTPEDLSNYLTKAESYRARPVGRTDWSYPQPMSGPLKLYQPAHGHFYLVAANLVCRITGMPDRVVDAGRREKVSFVLRRCTGTGKDYKELAWVNDPTNGKGWKEMSDPRTVHAKEELLPMFPVNFSQNNRRRRLLVGLVPTSSRESFQAGKDLSPLNLAPPAGTATLPDPRLGEVQTKVIEPLRALKTDPKPPDPDTRPSDLKDRIAVALTKQRKIASLFLMLDFAEFLNTYFPSLMNSIQSGTSPTGELKGLYDKLDGVSTDIALSSAPSWRIALKTVWQPSERDKITGESEEFPALTYNLHNSPLSPDDLLNTLKSLFDAVPVQDEDLKRANHLANPDLTLVPKLDPTSGARYVLRCVFQRPECGPLHQDLVSSPTQEFLLASFFDFDAPARPVRITLPVDTSIAGLRKFNKNVGFVISNQLREQMSRVVDLKATMDGNLAEGEEFDLGELCSFSIPIITICALIVLMIFINLLNIIFWWLPLLKICLPIGLVSKLKPPKG